MRAPLLKDGFLHSEEATTPRTWSEAARWSASACAGLLFVLAVVEAVKNMGASLGATRFDDAFAFVRYAKHALAADGYSWNLGEGPRFGCTSPLYLFIVTAARAASAADDAQLLTALSFAFHFLSVAATVAIAFIVLPVDSLSRRTVPWLIGAYFVCERTLLYHAGTGMETTLSSATNALLVLTAVRAGNCPSRLNRALCLICAGLTTLARPDNAIYATAFAPLLWHLAYKRPNAVVWQFLGGYAALLAVHALVNWQLFGSLLPLAGLAKSVGLDRGYMGLHSWPVYAYLVKFAALTVPLWLVVLLTVHAQSTGGVAAAAFPLAMTFVGLSSATQIMGYEARFYLPSLPFVVFMSVSALAAARRATTPHPWLRALRAGVCICLAGIVLHPGTARAASSLWLSAVTRHAQPVRPKALYTISSRQMLPAMDWWGGVLAVSELARKLPVGARLAASEHGYIGARSSELAIIDLTGLHDPTIAAGGFSSTRFFAQHPDVIWMPNPHYTATTAAILDHPTFQTDYEFYPGALTYGIAWRHDAPFAPMLRREVAALIARQVPNARLEDFLARLVTPGGHVRR